MASKVLKDNEAMGVTMVGIHSERRVTSKGIILAVREGMNECIINTVDV